MKITKYAFIIETNKRILQFLAAAFLMMPAIYYFTGNLSYTYYVYFLLPVPFLTFLINRYIRKLYFYIPLLFCLSAAVLLPVWHKPVILLLACILFLIVIMVQNFVTSLHMAEEQKKNTSFVTLLFPLVSMIFIYSQSLTILTNRMFILFFTGILIFLVNHYMIHLTQYMRNNSDITGIPYKQILSSNHLLIGLFLFLCFAVMLLFLLFPMKSVLTAVGSTLLFLLRAFFGLFSNEAVPEAADETAEQAADSSAMDFFSTQNPETSPLMLVLEKIFIAAGVIFIIAAVVSLLVYLLLLFYRYYYGRNQDSRDTSAFLSPFDKREHIIHKDFDASIKHRHFSVFRTKSEKIRYIFMQAVQTRHKDDIPKYKTAYELLQYEEESHSLIRSELDKMLASLYNKARYSREECTSDDVHLTRVLVRQYLSL